jgi:serine/threonine-protein kinase
MSSPVFERPNPNSPHADSEIPGRGAIIAEKYEVEGVLGAGGMGVVVAARHLQLGQRVAIKFMRGAYAGDKTAVERFLREARAAVALSSEHVAKVADVGTLPNGAPYMVMEYLAGRDLGQIVRSGGPMAIPAAIDAVLQACEAIAEAHSLGIAHRDLKPSNLFLTTGRDGRAFVKVLDFGISTAASRFDSRTSGEGLTETGTVMGSPGYMSPEQIRNAKAADARSDIWSLGVILYELLTGEAPFMGSTLGETFARIFSEDPPPIRAKRPDVPPELERTILQCLERDPKRRVPSVTSLAPRLARFAPVDSAVLVGRIASFAGDRTGTVSAPSGAPTFSGTQQGALGNVRAPYEETGPAWLTSAARMVTSKKTIGTMIGTLIAIVGVACALGFFIASRIHPTGGAPGAPPSASVGEPAPPSRPVTAEPAPAPSAAPGIAAPGEAIEPSAGDAGPKALAAPAIPSSAPVPRAAPPKKPSSPKPAPTNTVPDFGY